MEAQWDPEGKQQPVCCWCYRCAFIQVCRKWEELTASIRWCYCTRGSGEGRKMTALCTQKVCGSADRGIVKAPSFIRHSETEPIREPFSPKSELKDAETLSDNQKNHLQKVQYFQQLLSNDIVTWWYCHCHHHLWMVCACASLEPPSCRNTTLLLRVADKIFNMSQKTNNDNNGSEIKVTL